MDSQFPFYNQRPSAKWENTEANPFALFSPKPILNQAREGRANPDDLLLAVNRMLGLAPARSTSSIAPVIPSDQAAKEAEFVYNESGARYARSKEEQVQMVRQLLEKLGFNF